MENYKILGCEWRSALHTVGFIAYATLNPANPGEWNSVVGFNPFAERNKYGTDPEEDKQYIAAHGAKLEWKLAEILFPRLDITKHKYYKSG